MAVRSSNAIRDKAEEVSAKCKMQMHGNVCARAGVEYYFQCYVGIRIWENKVQHRYLFFSNFLLFFSFSLCFIRLLSSISGTFAAETRLDNNLTVFFSPYLQVYGDLRQCVFSRPQTYTREICFNYFLFSVNDAKLIAILDLVTVACSCV